MKHHVQKRSFGRKKNQYNALMRSLALNLIVRGRMKTTLAKAKELRPYIEKMVTRAKVDTPTNRRLIKARLVSGDKEVKKLFDEIAKKYLETNGGYTRILKLGPRKSDSAEMAIIEFV